MSQAPGFYPPSSLTPGYPQPTGFYPPAYGPAYPTNAGNYTPVTRPIAAPVPAPITPARRAPNPPPKTVPDTLSLTAETRPKPVMPMPSLGPIVQGLPNAAPKEAVHPYNFQQQAPAHLEKPQGMKALGLIKLGGGVVVGAMSAIMFGAPISVMIGFDMLLGALETLGTKTIYDGKSPITRKILAISNKLARGTNKPVEQLSPQEKEKSIAPLSAGVTLLSTVATGKVADMIHHRFHKDPLTTAQINELSAVKRVNYTTRIKLQDGLKTIARPFNAGKAFLANTIGQRLKSVLDPVTTRLARYRVTRPVLNFLSKSIVKKYAGLAITGLFLGWLEGFVAHKLGAAEEAHQAHKAALK